MPEPFQLTKKDKCKIINVDFYEIYLAMIDSSNKLYVFALNTLLPIYYIELPIQVVNITFGRKSEEIAVFSEKEILIYTLKDDIIFQKKMEINNLIKFDFMEKDYLILTQTHIQNSIMSVDTIDPITFEKVHYQKNNNLLILFQDSIQLFQNLSSQISYQQKFNMKSKLRYDNQQQLICVFETNQLSIFFIFHDQIKHRHTLPLNIEKIQDGCFFSLPFYKQPGFYGDQIFIYMAMTRGKLGSQFQFVDQDGDRQCIGNTFQEKKCKTIIPISKWGNNLLVLFEQGCLNRIKLYKFPQFEKLDFKFQYYPKNETYSEQEDEFDKKIKQSAIELKQEQFSQRILDPYYSYCNELA
ncbi:unnamed protein product [Paramecium sonneborni]|uniref:Uncharacterized protein n=1 Tax=Paramecium sonneborni TaxID=65129 RepID=A0A8S1NWN3_9CILI|nr:unnamed protein product [Paramecium sonneborni]